MPWAPFVSVVVPAFNVSETVTSCIESVLAQDWPAASLEVFVVDNGSNDGTAELAQRFPVKVLREPKRGRSAARNRGVRESRGEVLAFIDADCEAPPDWIQKSVAALVRPWIGAVQARVRKHGAPPSSLEFSQANYYRPFLDTCAMVSTRQAYDNARGFDEELRRNVDMDYSFRLLACGYALAWLPQVTMIKHHDLAILQALRRGWDGGLSVSSFAKKWRSVHPSNARRIWTDRAKGWAHFALSDLRNPLEGRGRYVAEASLKLLASVWGDLVGGPLPEARYDVRAPVSRVLGAARSLVVSGTHGLLFDASAESVTVLNEGELVALFGRIDGFSDDRHLAKLVRDVGLAPDAALAAIARVDSLIADR